MHKLHKEISDEIEESNVNYKLQAVIKKKFKTFNVGDYVMVRIHLKRFLPGTVKKLHARSVGPFKILNKLNVDIYIIYLPKDFDISYTFNIEDLVNYKGLNFNPNNPLVDKPSPELFSVIPSLPSPSDTHLIQQRELIKF